MGVETQESNTEDMCMPPAHASWAFHILLGSSDAVYCIHTVEYSKQEGLLAVAQNCIQCGKKKNNTTFPGFLLWEVLKNTDGM